MVLTISIIGILLSGVLLYFNARKHRSSVYLGTFFFILSFYVFNQYVLFSSKSVFLVSIFLTHFNFLFYLIGPMLYWYIRSVVTDNPHLKKADLLHLLPMAVYFIAALPYFFSSYSHKEEVARAIIKDFDFIWEYKQTVLSDLFSSAAVYLSRHFLVLGYTLWSAFLFIRYLVRREHLTVFSGQNFMMKWISVLLGFQILLISSRTLLIVRTFFVNSDVFYTLNVLQVISFSGLIGLLVTPFFLPEILYGLPRTPKSGSRGRNLENMAGQLTTNGAGNRINLEPDYLSIIGQKTNQCMEEDQPFLLPDMNLNRFAVMTGIPLHHLAYYFREIKKQTFVEYRNEWRIKHAIKLIEEGNAERLKLEAIGSRSGFINRSTFFKAFKKFTGISPNELLTHTRT